MSLQNSFRHERQGRKIPGPFSSEDNWSWEKASLTEFQYFRKWTRISQHIVGKPTSEKKDGAPGTRFAL